MGKRVSVIGLGKLGACMAAVYASKGNRVIGVDLNPDFVYKINKGIAPVVEKDLKCYIKENMENLEATLDYEFAIHNSEISFIIVPTPTDETGGFSASFVVGVCKSIGKVLANKNHYHLIVLTSTLLPGDCETKIIPVLEEYSGKKCGRDFGFCYSPEFIAIGSVIHDLLNPNFFLIGEYDQNSGGILENFYSNVSANGATSKRMSIPSAELTKISVNSFLTMKITYANMLTEIAENIVGVDIDKVTNAIGSDKRIGKYYLKGGLGYGGPCFPRDNQAFAYMAKIRGVEAPFAEKTDCYNKTIIERSIGKIKKALNDNKSAAIGVIGLSYKPGTCVVEESQALQIANRLSVEGFTVNVFEPYGYEHAKIFLKDRVTYCKNLADCVRKSNLIFLGNLDKSNSPLVDLAEDTIIIDPWRQFKQEDFKINVSYMSFGI